ncbi:MAG: cytochrome c biogenesis protein ResB [Syntrophorhabdaceae bacterium]|nr:cytochrome c biogenesis protein ResB [Syntrophorhabdaceae bacterium]
MSVIKNNRGEPLPAPEKKLKDRLIGFFGSVKLAVSVLTFIAVTSVLGTIIKQNASPEEYLSFYSPTILKIISFFMLDDVYHAPWFIAALILFVINLMVCTYIRFFRYPLREKKVRLPEEKALMSFNMCFKVSKDREKNALALIKKRFRRVIYEGEDGVVLEKAPYGRYGVLLIHLSIFIILIGSLIGLLWGYKGFIVLHKGEQKDMMVIRGRSPKEIPLGFAIRCKDFNVSLYPNGTPKDYVSRLEVIEKDRVLFERDVRVNSPLNHRGIHIYQSSYGASPTFVFNVDGESVSLREQDAHEDGGFIMIAMRFERAIHDFGPGVQVAFLDDGEPRTAWFLRDIPRMRQKELAGKRVILEDIKEDLWTGLEASYDPGIIFVWIGFGLMMVGLYINFFVCPGKIFIRRLPEGIIIAGVGSKHIDRFQEIFEEIKGKLYDNDTP